MLKSLLIVALCLIARAAPAADLTAQEIRWLEAAAPVLGYAQTLNLPIDIVVQPTAGANDVPMAMGFDGKRCKLVLSMRGGADADAILVGIAHEQRPLMIEAMAAHEVGHCWRYVQGVWHALPAGFTQTGQSPAAGDAQLAQMRLHMREMRREEGYSDLVALAWTARRHPDQYQAVLGWLETVRAAGAIPRGGHDTMAWVALARDPGRFKLDATPFEAVDALWSAGLLRED